jgi:beta-phosphoglucomutase-like phosphatase (HAD superfamily)
MQFIEGILFEPVGCLAEFPAEPFHEIAVRLFGGRKRTSKSGSRSYWHLLNLIEAADRKLDPSERAAVESLEVQAVNGANVYDDVVPALSELKAMGTRLILASSLSKTAVTHFLERYVPPESFSAVWSRDTADGVKALPLRSALACSSLDPERTIVLTDTAEGLKVAKSVGVHSILMMNDPDEAKRLAMNDPAGGIVSLYELPDFVRLIAARNA